MHMIFWIWQLLFSFKQFVPILLLFIKMSNIGKFILQNPMITLFFKSCNWINDKGKFMQNIIYRICYVLMSATIYSRSKEEDQWHSSAFDKSPNSTVTQILSNYESAVTPTATLPVQIIFTWLWKWITMKLICSILWQSAND